MTEQVMEGGGDGANPGVWYAAGKALLRDSQTDERQADQRQITWGEDKSRNSEKASRLMKTFDIEKIGSIIHRQSSDPLFAL